MPKKQKEYKVYLSFQVPLPCGDRVYVAHGDDKKWHWSEQTPTFPLASDAPLAPAGLQRYVDVRFAVTAYNALLKDTGQRLVIKKGLKFSCPKCGARFSTSGE
jgi:hypothetical protein